MKRLIDKELLIWKDDSLRKPLLLKGARQVGKTYAVRNLGKKFKNFVEINLEFEPNIRSIFEKSLDPKIIIRDISLEKDIEIIAGKTLLFIDEIQAVPQAVISLRYFYEMMPELHVIGAGSLLDFAIEKVGIPVGRVVFLYMYPMNFIEFLEAIGHHLIVKEIVENKKEFSEFIHDKVLGLVGQYLAIGGLPEAVKCWRDTQSGLACFKIHNALLDTYRADFDKYAKNLQIKYLNLLFNSVPKLLGSKFVYSHITDEYRSRELAPALDLLETAGLIHKVHRTVGNGVPIGAEMYLKDFKVIFLDVALAQAALGLDLKTWITNLDDAFVNRGPIVEAFIGQEILSCMPAQRKGQLYFWRREERASIAEVDYLIEKDRKVIPVEVKRGVGTTLKSMHKFLETHPNSPYGIRFSANKFSIYEKIHSYPLYAVSRVIKSAE